MYSSNRYKIYIFSVLPLISYWALEDPVTCPKSHRRKDRKQKQGYDLCLSFLPLPRCPESTSSAQECSRKGPDLSPQGPWESAVPVLQSWPLLNVALRWWGAEKGERTSDSMGWCQSERQWADATCLSAPLEP